MEKMGLWMYCIIENKGALNVRAHGIHGTSPIRGVSAGDFTVVVSEEPMKKYPLMRDFLMAHQLVNEEVMQIQPVLPVKFCTMAENEGQILKQVLGSKDRTKEFQETFAKVKGAHEMGLRARWADLDKVFARLGKANENILKAKEKAGKVSAQGRQTALIDVGHVVKEALEDENERMRNLLMQELIPLAVGYKKGNVLGDMNILNSAFLVQDKKQKDFDEAVNELVGRFQSQIQFKYVGPVPPFNFVEIVIRWAEELKDPKPKMEVRH